MKENNKKPGCFWKSRKIAALILYVFLIAACMGSYWLGMARKQDLETYRNRVTLIRADGNSYSWQEAEQIRARNQEAETPLRYVLWGDEGRHLLENPDLERFAETEIYVLEDSSNLLFSSTALLDGTIEKSCLIGSDIAQDLFGVSDATGMSVTLENQKCFILGMLSDVKKGAVFLSEDRKTSALDRISIQIEEDNTPSSLEQRLEMEMGGSWIVLDYRLLNNLTDMLSFGLCFLLWFWLLRLLVTEWKQYQRKHRSDTGFIKHGNRMNSRYLAGVFIRAGCICGAIILLTVYLRFQVKIPDDMIPTKWSDFDFWSRLFEQKKEYILNWIKCGKSDSEMIYIAKTVRTILWFALSYLCYFVIRLTGFVRSFTEKRIK